MHNLTGAYGPQIEPEATAVATRPQGCAPQFAGSGTSKA